MKSLFPSVRKSVLVLLSTVMLTVMGMPLFLTANASAAVSYDTRYNWSGYVANGHTFNKVQALITVPAVTCTVSDAEVLDWVGFDGYTDQTIEQAGIEAKCVGKTPTYYGWWEMYNSNIGTSIHRISQGTLKIYPGSKVYTAVDAVGVRNSSGRVVTEFQMQLANITTKQRSFITTQPCATGGGITSCKRNTAEWVTERYVKNGSTDQDAPLAKFSYDRTLFSNAEATTTTNATLEAIARFNSTQIDMVSKNGVGLDITDSLSGNGTYFGVTWSAAQ